MRIIPCKPALLSIVAALAVNLLLQAMPLSAAAGQLGDFERDATNGKRSGSSNSSSSSSQKAISSDDLFSDIAGDCLSEICVNIFGDLFKAIAAGGAISMRRVEDENIPDHRPESTRRKSGDALLPFFRFDITHQEVEGDLTAQDSRFEGGYGSVAVEFRKTVYREKVPADKMEITELHALYRMSVNSDFEIDLGAGLLTLTGNQTTSGFSVTLPLLYHPSEFFGVEFRPVWSSLEENSIQDIEAAVLLGWRYLSLKAGYRWMHSPHQSLDGPEIGVSLRW